jgi:asparagine synthase (glutamine-hydrolysing)
MYELAARAREGLFSTRMWESLDGHDPYGELNLTNRRIRRWHPLNQGLYVDCHGVLQGVLVSTKADRVSMNSSVETRPPFLDEDLVAFCAKLHPGYKLWGLREKWILRRVAERMLPKRIAWRLKWPFMATFSMTFLGPERPGWVDQLISAESLRATGYFDPAAVERHRQRQVRGRWWPLASKTFDLGLTTVVATQLWHHTFCGGGLADLPAWSPPPAADHRPAERLQTFPTGAR